jgi:CDP-glycerol glycerophosphotransferase (TagB/SpsB family)
LSGFARYDLLENNPKNIISIAPTWRRGLGVSWRNKNNNKDQLLESFSNTEYYQMYKKMLTNKELLNKCRDKKITIQLALHPEMMNYVELFDVFDNDVVKVVHSDDLVYKDMFEQSKLLVTDYSSVFFDFSYLKKPILYFQFDEKQFFQSHYKKGYFDYRKDGLGPVITDCNDAIKKIIDYIDKDFKIEDEYLKRIEKTFKFHDKNNSKRIIDSTYKKEK